MFPDSWRYRETQEHIVANVRPQSGCSIWAVELIRREIVRMHPEATNVNAVLIDFFLYDLAKAREAQGACFLLFSPSCSCKTATPQHKRRGADTTVDFFRSREEQGRRLVCAGKVQLSPLIRSTAPVVNRETTIHQQADKRF